MSIDDTSQTARDAQVAMLRALSNAERASLATRLSSNAIALSRRANPDWSEFEVKLEWARLHYGEDVAALIRRWAARQSVE